MSDCDDIFEENVHLDIKITPTFVGVFFLYDYLQSRRYRSFTFVPVGPVMIRASASARA